MKKLILAMIIGTISLSASAQDTFEDATSAVRNMRIGWNAGNRLDSNSGDVNNMWIEGWTERTPTDYETAWGQKPITRELIHMMHEAGFNAIRLPVTWYPHMGNVIVDPSKTDWKAIWDLSTWTGYDIDAAWMARVKECVDMVTDEGMYCIVNVHHDTGSANTAWLRASEEVYAQQKERFEALWTNIAKEFKDYGELLIFEGYNEMLDSLGSWCFASFGAKPSNYDAKIATGAYNAINSYAQSFVNAVRATGGNNTQRNLIVNTYGACCGEGTWNPHLVDPLKNLQMPTDEVENHIIAEVHSYPSPTSNANAKKVVDQLLNVLKEHLAPKAPIVLGEWGIGNESAKPYFNTMAEYMVSRCKEEGIATFLWMVFADGDDALVPKWSDPDLKDAIVRGYYGEEGYNGKSATIIDTHEHMYYNLQGMPLVREPESGMYIRDGKVVIRR